MGGTRRQTPPLLLALALWRLVSSRRLLIASTDSRREHAPSLADFGTELPEGAAISEAELAAIVQKLVEARDDEEANRCTISLEPLLVDGKAGPDGLVALVEPPGEGARPGAEVRVNMYNVDAARRWYCVDDPVDPVINLPLRSSSRVLVLSKLEGPLCPNRAAPGGRRGPASEPDFADPEWFNLRAEVAECNVDAIRSRLETMTNESVRGHDLRGRTVLFSLVHRNCVLGAPMLLERMDAATISVQEQHGYTALHEAVKKGQHQLASMLLARMYGTAVHARLRVVGREMSALDTAAMKGFVATTRVLLAHTGAAELRSRDGVGRTALHFAVDLQGDVRCDRISSQFDEVIDKCAVIRMLLERMDDSAVQLQDNRGRAAMHIAVEGGAEEAVETLLAGMSAEAARAPDGFGWTPLHHAAHKGKPGVLHALLEGIPDDDFPGVRGSDGRTALHLAMARRGAWYCDDQCVSQQRLVRELLEHMNRSAASALHIAARSAHERRTALHEACARADRQYANSSGQLANVHLLLQYMSDEDVGAADADGMTALHHAAARHLPRIIPELLASMDSAAIGAPGNHGWTALHWVVMHGDLSLVRLIAGRMDRAALLAEDSDGRTAAHRATAGGYEEAANYILARI